MTDTDRIDNVAAGDLITLERDGVGEREYKVVFLDSSETATGTTFTVTFAGDDGETFDMEMAADTPVLRSLESKWESPQSPTPHDVAE